jgi:hypothetical protein
LTAGQSHFVNIEDNTFIGSDGSQASIDLIGADNAQIRHNNFIGNNIAWGVLATYTGYHLTNSIIEDNRFDNTWLSAVFFNGFNNTVTGNHVTRAHKQESPTGGGSIALNSYSAPWSADNLISGNIITSPGGEQTLCIELDAVTHNIVSNNICYAGYLATAISLAQSGGGTYSIDNIITGNMVYAGSSGVWIANGVNNFSVTNNYIHTRGASILLDGANDYYIIAQNYNITAMVNPEIGTHRVVYGNTDW